MVVRGGGEEKTKEQKSNKRKKFTSSIRIQTATTQKIMCR